MEYLTGIIAHHAHHAHWYIFIAIILAGFNVPLSADLLILAAAVLAATIVPEHTWLLFFTILVGCYLSAMCAYWLGRLIGTALGNKKFFSRLLSAERLSKIRRFYERYGLWALVIGRFIPFGVRNCIFMSSGMSRLHFGKFILMDALACVLWCSTYFYLFFILGRNYETIWYYLKTFNLLIFAAFSVTVISIIWYKSRKKTRAGNLSTN
jgi:membrane protein DedA with SNARE-associated domain